MNKKIEKVIVLAIILSASLLLLHFTLYRYESTSIFYFLMWSVSILTAVFSLYADPKGRFTRLFILILVIMILRAFTPFSTPSAVIDNMPETNYHFQIVQIIDENDRLIFSPDLYTWGAEQDYGYPMLELLLIVLAKVTCIDLSLLIKYFSYALGFPALLFVVCYYRRHLGLQKDEKILMLAVLLFASCPWFIGFTARAVHLSLSFPLFILTLSMLLPQRKASLIVFLLLISTILTHHFMGFFLIACIVFYRISRYINGTLSKSFPKRQFTLFHLFFVFVVAFTWAIQLVPHTTKYLFSFFISVGEYVFLKPWVFGEATHYLQPYVGKPAWMLAVQTAGYTSFLAFGLLGFAWAFLKKAFRKKGDASQNMNIDTLALLFCSAVLVLPYWLGFGRGVDLMWRALLFAFLGLAPFAAKSLIMVNNRSNKLGIFRFIGKFLIIITLSFIIQNAIYNGLPYYCYDPSAEMHYADPRLNLVQWVGVARFVKESINLDTVYGVRIAFNLVGALAKKNIIQLASDPITPEAHIIEPSMLANGEIEKGQIFILRKSLVTVPDPKNYTFSQKELGAILNRFNIIFHSEDAIIIST